MGYGGGAGVDWSRERDRVDILGLLGRYLGPAPGRGGRGNFWHCPFHQDPGPSFLADPARARWRCFGCGLAGDSVDFVMRVDRVPFREAVERVLGGSGACLGPGRPAPRPPAPEVPTGLPEAEALALVEAAEARLWGAEGLDALMELVDLRGLELATIRRARLGWSDAAEVPRRDKGPFTARGLVIPWFGPGGRLAKVNIRQPDGSVPKYAAAFGDRPRLYPGPGAVEPGLPAVIVEGEFDALLLGQELAGLASVVTLGAASIPPREEARSALLASPRWFVATDADTAGDEAAARWTSARAHRARPPEPFKDWTEAHRGGLDLRAWWSWRLGPAWPPTPARWEDLAGLRWGPGVDDPAPGVEANPPRRDPEAISQPTTQLATFDDHNSRPEAP